MRAYVLEGLTSINTPGKGDNSYQHGDKISSFGNLAPCNGEEMDGATEQSFC